MPKGGKRDGSGRKPGSLNKATAEIKVLAQEYGPLAIARLALLAGLTAKKGSDSEQTQVSAIRELLDRGYGKAAQAHTGPDGKGAVQIIVTGVRRALDEKAR